MSLPYVRNSLCLLLGAAYLISTPRSDYCKAQTSGEAGPTSTTAPSSPQNAAQAAGSQAEEQTPEQGSDGAEQAVSKTNETPGPYVVLQGNGQVVDLSSGPSLQWVYGASLAGIYYDFARARGPRTASGVSLGTPYLGLLGRTHKFYYMVNYTPSLPFFLNHKFWPTQPFELGSFFLTGHLTRRWSWSLDFFGSYGDETLRRLAPLAFEIAGSTPIASATSAVFEAGDRKVLASSSSFGLQWQRNAHDRVNLNLRHSYLHYGPGQESIVSPSSHVNSSRAGLDYAHRISERSSIQLVGNATRVYNPRQCFNYGVGLGFAFNNPRYSVQLNGGPAKTSAGCGARLTTFAHALLTGRLSTRTSGYVGLDRHYSTAYRLNGRWEDVAVAGIEKEATASTSGGFSGGYVRGDRLGALPSNHGYFLSPYVRRMLSKNFSLVASYRRFYWSAGIVKTSSNMEILSLEWSPLPAGAYRF